MIRTFRNGGIHPPQNRPSAEAPIERIALPERVVVPLLQHTGSPAVPVVAKDEKVLAGQLIAEAGGFISANIHSPVSGTVEKVGAEFDAFGILQPAVTIKVEGDEWMPGIDRSPGIMKGCPLSPGEIVGKIGDAGIVGLGGAAFPSRVKLTLPAGKRIGCLIINGAECEPCLTSDYRVMLERGMEMLTGASLLAKAIGADKICIGIENDKPAAIAHLRGIAAGFLSMEVVPLRTKYPQGCEKMLIAAVTGRKVPPGGLPVDVGVIVHNVGTALAVYEAVQKNKPLFERVVTVTGGSIDKPSNFMVRIGTPISALIEAAGGLPSGAEKIIAGGPMMGRAVANADAPLVKGISGIVVVDGKGAFRHPETYCIKCAACVSVCPMGLEPYLLSKLSQRRMTDALEERYVADCIECGCCAYTCPSRIPLLDWIRQGKTAVMKEVNSRHAVK